MDEDKATVVEGEVVAEGEEQDYAKPDPAKNPRNIALGEIAASVAKQHERDIVTDNAVSSIDEDGNVTAPAAAAPTEAPAEPAAQEVAPAVAAVEAPAVVTDPGKEVIEPAKLYKVKVDGVEVEVPGQKIIDAGFRTFQKETAADLRLKQATELLRDAEQRRPQQEQPRPAPVAEPEVPSDAELAQAIQFGTPEQAAAAVATLKTRGALDPQQIQNFVVQQTRSAARDEMQFQDALSFVKTEYSDLLSNDYLKRLFFVEENRRRAPKERGGEGDTRPYRELYAAIGDDLRKSFNLAKPQAAPPTQPSAAATPGSAQARIAAKASAPAVPRTAASRLSAQEGASKVKSPSEIIATMAAARGKDRLSPTIRKD